MFKNNKRHRQKHNPMTKLAVIVAFVIAFMTIGYSAFEETGIVDDIGAFVTPQTTIRITGVTVSNSVGDALSGYEEYNPNNVSSSLQLPYSNSKLTYQVEVTNYGNIEMILKSITGLPANLEYSIDPNNYELNDMICDDIDNTKCTLGARKVINIVIRYATNGYNSSSTTYAIQLDFDFEAFDKVAQVGTNYFQTLQAAINSINTSTQTTVHLLKDTSEAITISSTQNIILNMPNRTISNNGNTNVIQNNGTLTIMNGTIRSNASTNGAVNNNQTGTITISGGSIIMTGGRQALYNDKGHATITGNAYLSSSATARAAVQNTSGGTMIITGGTIVSTGSYGVNNTGTMTIGIKDGNINDNSPIIQGVSNGVYATSNFKYYDGSIKSKTNPISDVSKVTETETGYGIVTYTEVISGETYNVSHLSIAYLVTFAPNGGTVSETKRYVAAGEAVGPLPIPIRSGYDFDGWFTLKNGGQQISADTTINKAETYYAHWTQTTNVASIGQTIYATLQDAINAVPTDDTPTTIKVLKDVSEYLTVSSGKNIIFDMQGQTLTNSGDKPIIENSGSISISNGTLRSSAGQSVINNLAGSLSISGGSIIATGPKQAVYITGGTVEISGSAYLSSATSGKPSGSNMERGTVHNVSGTLIVTGGTIIATKQQAISNEDILIMGVSDGSLDITTPVLQGDVYGIKSTGTFSFYDGIIKGRTNAIVGTINNQEANTEVANGTETISGKTYKTAYLEATQ